MEEIFHEPIRNLPEAAMSLRGVKAWLSQGQDHQIIFMHCAEGDHMPEHAHGAQVGIVLEGRIDITIGGETQSYVKGDRYYIPGGVRHSGRVYAGFAQVAFFDDPDRYKRKE